MPGSQHPDAQLPEFCHGSPALIQWRIKIRAAVNAIWTNKTFARRREKRSLQQPMSLAMSMADFTHMLRACLCLGPTRG